MSREKTWTMDEATLDETVANLKEWLGTRKSLTLSVDNDDRRGDSTLFDLAEPAGWIERGAHRLLLRIEGGRTASVTALPLDGSLAGSLKVVPTSRGAAWVLCVDDAAVALLVNAHSELARIEATDAGNLVVYDRPDLTGIERFAAVESAGVCFCRKLKELRPLGRLSRLRHLSLGICPSLRSLAGLAGLAALSKLVATSCNSLADFRELARLSALESLAILPESVKSWPTGAVAVHDDRVDARELARAPGLRKLRLRDVTLKHADSLCDLRQLEELHMLCCTCDDEPIRFGRMSNLRKLRLAPFRLTSTRPLRGLTGLEQLDLCWADDLEDIDDLAELTELDTLHISAGSRLKSLQPLAGLTGLRTLDLSTSDSAVDIDCIAGLTRLESLSVSGDCVTDLSFLRKMTRLRDLRPSGEGVADLRPLRRLKKLEELDLSSSGSLENIEPLRALTSLKELSLTLSGKIRDFEPLRVLKKLERFYLRVSDHLESADVFAGLESLRVLHLDQCHALRDVKGLSRLRRLEDVSLESCPALEDISGLAGLPSLKKVRISFWDSLRDRDEFSRSPDKAEGRAAVLETLATCPELRDLKYLEDGVLMHEILADCAVLRKDLGYIKDHGRTWLYSLPRTADPQRTVRRFSRAFALAADTKQGAEHLSQLVAFVEKWALAREDLVQSSPPR